MSNDSVQGSLCPQRGFRRLRDFGACDPAARDAHDQQNRGSDQGDDAVPGGQEKKNENERRQEGSVNQRCNCPARQKRPQLADLDKIVCPALAAPRVGYNSAFENDRRNVALKSDCKAAEQPAAQGIKQGAEDESTCGDDSETNKRFNAAAANDPVEHLDGIEGNDQKQQVYGRAK